MCLCVVGAVTTVVRGEDAQPKRVLLLSQGPDGHPAKTHEYAAGTRVLAACLREVPGVVVREAVADEPWIEGPELIRDSDGVVLFLSEGAKWIHAEPRRLEAFGQLAGRGGGFVAIHWGMGTQESRYIKGFLELFGGCHGGPDRKYQVLDTWLRVRSADHAIMTALSDVQVHDEFYFDLKFVDTNAEVTPLAAVDVDGVEKTVAWAWQRGDGGRSFGFSGVHFHKNLSLVEYRRLLCQGILWTVRVPIPPTGLAVDIAESPQSPN